MAFASGAFLVGKSSTSSAVAGILTKANPVGRDVILTDFLMDVTTASTAAHGVSADVTNTSTTPGTGLINAVDTTTAGPYRSSGLPKLWKSTQYVVIQSTSGDLGAFVGRFYARWVARSDT